MSVMESIHVILMQIAQIPLALTTANVQLVTTVMEKLVMTLMNATSAIGLYNLNYCDKSDLFVQFITICLKFLVCVDII